jgi:hypothetical protein
MCDAVNMQANSQGGDDILTLTNSSNDFWVYLFGDAQNMQANVQGGKWLTPEKEEQNDDWDWNAE